MRTLFEDAKIIGIDFDRYLMEDGIDLEKLEDSTYMLDILLQCENVLDMFDVYTALNWFDGEVVKGPIVRRHWVSFSLLYPHDKMPDPRMALRLLKHGIQCEFNQVKREVAGDVNTRDHEPKKPTDWLVTITIPRRLLDQTEEAELEAYDDEVNPDDVIAAKDIGLDDQSTLQQDEQAPEGMPQAPMEGPPGGIPPQGIIQPQPSR